MTAVANPGSAPLRRLSTLAARGDLSDLHIPTITDDAEDVVGLRGRIRLQKDETVKEGQVRDRNWMDKQRQNLQAYEYLCHIGEAKEWIEDCLAEKIEPITELEEALRTGISLAKLAKWFGEPGTVKRIFADKRLQFRHSDNINYFFKAIKQVQLPQIFWFELTDLYERKNIPKVIYCIHALSYLLARRGLAPTIKNLVGQLEFTDEELRATQLGLDRSGVSMPVFANVGASLRRELNEPDAEEEYEDEEAEESDIEEAEYVNEVWVNDLDEVQSIEAEESEEEVEVEDDDELTEGEKFDQYWSDPRNQYLLRKAQSFARTYLFRKDFLITQEIHQWAVPLMIALQAHCRGVLVRERFHRHLEDVSDVEDFLIRFQACARGAIARRSINERMDWFQKNEAKVVKIQSFFRSKVQGEKYRMLTLGKNPSTGTVKDFIHLLDDSDFDFEEELEIQRGQQSVVRKIRENTALDNHLNDLDIKIALLVKNRITLEEVIKLSKTMSKKEQRRMSVAMAQGNYSQGASNPSNIFSLQSLDKEAHDQLELYQNLFYLLQTQPSYLARLLYITSEKAGPKQRKVFQTFVLSMFGHAQGGREEYLLLKLFQYCIREEIARCITVQEFMRGNYGFLSLVVQYNRGAKERQYLRDLLRPLVKEIIDNPNLDLCTDPLILYNKSIAFEESETGMQSVRPLNVTPREALLDPLTRNMFIKHLQDLQATTEQFLEAITASLRGMPYGIRFIAGELARALKGKFQEESEDVLRRVVGNFVYYRYLNPALVAPEMFDVVEEVVSDPVRKNLGEVARMLQMAATGKIFEEEKDMYVASLNKYVVYAGERLGKWFDEVPKVSSLESYFDINPWTDMTAVDKPTIWISPAEIFAVHTILYENYMDLSPNPDDPFHEIIAELGPPPEYSSDPVVEQSMQGEISLRLTNRYQNVVQAPDAAIDHLFMETKREVLYVMKVQSGPHLMEILLRRVDEQEEALWDQIRLEEDQDSAFGASSEEDSVGSLDGRSMRVSGRKSLEVGRKLVEARRKSAEAGRERRKKVFHNGGYRDIRTMRFVELKAITLENMSKLENSGRVTRKNNFQDMVNSIAVDITNKHRRRFQRQKELRTIRQTLSNLDEKRSFLDESKETYLAYIDACMNQLSSKNSRRRSRLVIPFTRQYNHLRDLHRSGRVPEFGSYVYTAKQLYDKGVLLSIEGVSPKQFDSIKLTISSNTTGEFKIEASLQALGVGVPGKEVMDLRFEDLLVCQFNGVLVMSLFEGAAKVNVNLLIFLVNKKFYT